MNKSHHTSYSGIPMQMLMMFEKSNDAWSIKLNNSSYIYANKATFSMLNLPQKFSIDGLRDENIPHPSAEYASFFYQQDESVINNQKGTSSFDVHPYGRENIIQPFVCNKYPFYNEVGVCIGVINHASKSKFYSSIDFYKRKNPFSLLLTPPVNLFSKRELEILFFLMRGFSAKRIAIILKISHRTVENRTATIYQKANVHSLSEFIEFCEIKGFDHYMPPCFLYRSSKIID